MKNSALSLLVTTAFLWRKRQQALEATRRMSQIRSSDLCCQNTVRWYKCKHIPNSRTWFFYRNIHPDHVPLPRHPLRLPKSCFVSDDIFLNGLSVCLSVSAGSGESTTDHLDLLDDNPIDQEDGYRYGHHNHEQLQRRSQNHSRHLSSSWEEKVRNNSNNPWSNDHDDGHDASAQWSRPGKRERGVLHENWEGDGEGVEGRAWKHEDLKQLLQVLTVFFFFVSFSNGTPCCVLVYGRRITLYVRFFLTCPTLLCFHTRRDRLPRFERRTRSVGSTHFFSGTGY